MTKSYQVFTFSPPEFSSTRRTSGFNSSWVTESTRVASPPLPAATLDKASHQISLLYQNVIFEDSDKEQDDTEEWLSVEKALDPTIEWPPTDTTDHSTRLDVTGTDNFRVDDSFGTDFIEEATTMLSEGSSISRFPVFSFNVNMLSSLSSIAYPRKSNTLSTKITILLGILEVDGPSYVTPKAGAYAGSEIALLKLILGDEHGALCRLIAWRQTAEMWGGVGEEPGLKRGDIVLFENVITSNAPQDRLDSTAKLQITASPNLKSLAHICYRTLPRTPDDCKWRPDLRLANSVPAVRKVSEVVGWMERMAGISVQ